MEKITPQTTDITSQNINQIAKLFPQVITEKEDANGNTIKAIDFELLKQHLSKDIIEGTDERYRLDWPGKRASILKANTPITSTLKPDRESSVNFDTTENVYIEGDNFEVLKILQESYLGKIKMIYIDPPYNTGKDFVYKDNFKVSKDEYETELGTEDEEGGKLLKNTDTNGRFHSDWLSMMYERLLVARDLLTDDGVIFMSIDDNEVHNLRKIADDVFGEQNFVSEIIWNCSTAGGIKPKFFSNTHEQILCFSKSKDNLSSFSAPLSNDALKTYNQENEQGIYRDKDFVFKNKSNNINQKYEIECPNGEIVHPKEGYIYRFIKETYEKALKEGLVTFKKSNNSPLLNSNNLQATYNIYIKKYLGDGTGSVATLIPKEYASIYNVGTKTVQGLFDNKRVFENVKPTDLLKYLIKIPSLNKDNLILDFFSGSATTAHATMQLNAEDGGNRKFIMVQIPEETDEKSEAYKAGYKTIPEIGKERIRRAGKKILEENEEKLKERTTPLDIGFRVYKTSESILKEVAKHPNEVTQTGLFDSQDNIKEDATSENILTAVLLDFGLTLDNIIATKDIAGSTIYFVDDNALVACFDTNIDMQVVEEIAKTQPLRAIFRDACFKDDKDLINTVESRFKQLAPNTKVHVI